MPTEPEGAPRDLRDHLGVVRRRAWVVLVVTALTVLAALVWSLRQTERYQATTQVLVAQELPTAADPLPDQQVETRRLDPLRVMQNEVRLASSELVRDRAAADVGGPVSGSVTNPRDTDVVSITATAASAERAAELANAWAAAYLDERLDDAEARAVLGIEQTEQAVTEIDTRLAAIDTELPDATGERRAALEGERAALLDQRAGWDEQRRRTVANAEVLRGASARVIDTADAPGSAAQPATARNLVLALLVGLGLGLVAAYAVEALDDRIRTPADLRRLTGLPVLGRTRTSVARAQPTALRLDAAELADLALDPAVLDAPAPGGAHVLVVAGGTRASEAREKVDALDRLGLRLAGAVLAPPTQVRRRSGEAGDSPPVSGERDAPAGERLSS
jgi:polysaccharide biosynthesis transport protein